MDNAQVRGYVGVTDDDWLHFLAAHPGLSEINFWRPGGGRGFHALAEFLEWHLDEVFKAS